MDALFAAKERQESVTMREQEEFTEKLLQGNKVSVIRIKSELTG